MIDSSKRKKNKISGEIEVSGYFSTGFIGEGEEEVPEKRDMLWLFAFVIFLTGALFARVTYLQVFRGDYYNKQAEENRIKHIMVEAPRGMIYDRNHKVIASNTPKFDLALVPGLIPKKEKERNAIFKEVSKIAGVPAGEVENKYKEFPEDSFDPVAIKEDLSREEALKMEIASSNWMGVILNKKAKRVYPGGEIFSNILGYAGKISDYDMKNRKGYGISDSIGKEGLEIQYEELLRGKKGDKQLEVDSFGQSKRSIGETFPVIGNSLVLTLNDDVQREAYLALKEKVAEVGGDGGAVVALNPKDGGVLALATFPSFDNNDFTGGISSQKFSEIMNDPKKPLFNRAISGTYPPGSTFKPLVAAAALSERIIQPNEVLNCPAVLNVGKWHFEDWKFHGETDLNRAIAESVNTYFYIIGGGWGDKKGLGPEKISEYCSTFGLGEKTGIDLPQEAKGLVPDPAWKEKTKSEPWYIGDTYHFSIGQGDLLVTPIQLASYVSAMVNGGTLFKPHFLDLVENLNGEVLDKKKPEITKENILPKDILDSVKKAMTETVSSDSGSGRTLQEIGKKYNIEIGGKTGTAQTGDGDKYHAWFVGFAPVNDPEIVVVVLVEKGGEGYSSAVPIAGKVMDRYFESR